MTRSCFHSKDRPTNTGHSYGALRGRIPSRFRIRRILHNRLMPQQLKFIGIPSRLRTAFKKVFTAILLITNSGPTSNTVRVASPTPDASCSSSTPPTAGVPVVAIDLPGIRHLLNTSLVQYTRLPHVRVQARRANEIDLQRPLITYVTDCHGEVRIETVKHFNSQDATSGIIFLRYPDPINDPRTNPRSKPIYNEWYVPLQSWFKAYHGTPGEEYASYESKNLVEKKGLVITPEVIRILGGRNGRAEVQPGWGGSMLALEGGLLVSDGSCIAPRILERYFKNEGPVAGQGPTPGLVDMPSRTRDKSNEVNAE